MRSRASRLVLASLGVVVVTFGCGSAGGDTAAKVGAFASTTNATATAPDDIGPTDCTDPRANCSPAEIAAAKEYLARQTTTPSPAISDDQAISRALRAAEYSVTNPTKTAVKHTTLADAFRVLGGPVWTPDGGDEVIVISVSGDVESVPVDSSSVEASKGGAATEKKYGSAIYVLRAQGGDVVTYRLYAETWPLPFADLYANG